MRHWGAIIKAFVVRLGIGGLVVGFLLGIGALAYFASVFPDWVGFAADPLPPGAAATPVVMYELDKDLWDWLQLLLVPLVLAVGGFWLTRTENRYALELQERREEENQRLEEQRQAEARRIEDERIKEAQRIEDERIKEARRIEDERAKDAALQAYLDQMTQLLLHENLLGSQPKDVVRTVARARTLTVFKQLDEVRRERVMQFLSEARLCSAEEGAAGIVSLKGAYIPRTDLALMQLNGADLVGANLQEAYLLGINLRRANLHGADCKEAKLFKALLEKAVLRYACLQKAQLQMADLTGADLTGADLNEANLIGANLTGANLTRANFTKAILTDAIFTDAKLDGAIGLPYYYFYPATASSSPPASPSNTPDTPPPPSDVPPSSTPSGSQSID